MLSSGNSFWALNLAFMFLCYYIVHAFKKKKSSQGPCVFRSWDCVLCFIGTQKETVWLRQEIVVLKKEAGRSVPGTFSKKSKGMTAWLGILLKGDLILT